MADDPLLINVIGPSQLIQSGMNKVRVNGASNDEGEGELIDEFTLDLDDDELLILKTDWENAYRGYEGKLKPRQDAQKAYYLGKKMDGNEEGTVISSNLMFEAVETFLPAALAKNPEPVVYADNTEEGVKLSGDVKTMLQYHADVLVLRRKLDEVTRNWVIYFLGVMKHGWDKSVGDIKSEVRHPQNFIFDPEGYIDSYGDYDGPLGERITVSATKLIKLFPKHKDYITVMVDGKLGTACTYTEWWNDDYTFTTFKDKVLDKSKNPFYNYEKEVPQLDPMGQPVLDETGQPLTMPQKGNNHFGKPKKPYTFLAVFSLGEQPHDITGLIEQNIPNQNRITRRTNQIDINISRANNSRAYSETNFTQETAKAAAMAMQKGNPVLVPTGGPIEGAIKDFPAAGIPDAAFNELNISKTDLRSIFGTEGISSQPPKEDTTARGMILNQQFDNTRIGGGIGDALEQFADNVFNWWVQLYYVYYDEQHYATIMGQMRAVEYVELSSADLTRRLVVSVSPDSMKSHDELTEMNQAVELFQMGALDPKTLLTMLNVPDPQKTAEMAVLWKLDPNAYLQLNFPEIAQQMQQIQQQQALTQAAAQQMGAVAGGGGAQGGAQAPPVPDSPAPTLSEEPASSQLSQVPIPK